MNHNDDSAHPPQGSFRDHGAAEPWVIENDQQLGGSFSGAVHVHEDAHFEITQDGDHQGSLVFCAGSGGHLAGRHVGPLDLGEGSSVKISGVHNGPVDISADAVLQVLPGGSLSGSLRVAGLVENRGVRAGNTVLAGGEVHDIDGGMIEPPVITRAETP